MCVQGAHTRAIPPTLHSRVGWAPTILWPGAGGPYYSRQVSVFLKERLSSGSRCGSMPVPMDEGTVIAGAGSPLPSHCILFPIPCR